MVRGSKNGRKREIPMLCHHCNKYLLGIQSLNQHISSVHLHLKPFRCSLCDTKCSQKGGLKAHMKACHSEEGNKPNSLCFDCGKSYNSERSLKTHLERHFPSIARPPKVKTPDQELKCGICNLQCNSLRRFNEHKLRHEGVRKFQCEESECEKSFKTRGDLQMHMKRGHILPREKPEKCHNCEKRYSTKDILKCHLYSAHKYSLEDARTAAGIGVQNAIVIYDY